MRTTKGDFGMTHICPWPVNVIDMPGTFEYDGLCSHCCLNESISGDFELSAEQLEAVAIQKKQHRTIKKAEGNSNYHHKQMETNRDDYLDKASKKTAKLKRKNPEKVRGIARKNAAKSIKMQTYHCELCKVSFAKKSELTRHKTKASHLRKADDLANKPHQCNVCNVAFDLVGNLNKHNLTERHKKMAAQSSSQLD
jgi:hypothetical protein